MKDGEEKTVRLVDFKSKRVETMSDEPQKTDDEVKAKADLIEYLQNLIKDVDAEEVIGLIALSLHKGDAGRVAIFSNEMISTTVGRMYMATQMISQRAIDRG